MTHSVPTRRSAHLRNTRRFASAAAKIVKLRTTHGTLADDGNDVDVGRIEREHALDTFAERHLEHGEVGAHALVRAGDAHAFEILHTGAFAFDHLNADFQRDVGTEGRNGLVVLGDFFGFDRLDDVHVLWSFFFRRAPEAGYVD